MAVGFGVKKSHNYLYGRQFIIESDHELQSYLFSELRANPAMASARIQRWVIILGEYQHSMCYKAGKNLGNVDALSRLPRPDTTSSDHLPGDHVHLLDHQSTMIISADNIRWWTSMDPAVSKVGRFIVLCWPNM